jgi:hypothetical protein
MSFKERIAKWLDIEPEIVQVQHTTERIKLIEIPVMRTQSGWSKEQRETVSTLAYNPGFVLLTDRLSLQAAALKAKLVADRHKEIRDVEFIQSGIFWCNWLQAQVTGTTTRQSVRRIDATEEDIEAIKAIEASYASVGE